MGASSARRVEAAFRSPGKPARGPIQPYAEPPSLPFFATFWHLTRRLPNVPLNSLPRFGALVTLPHDVDSPAITYRSLRVSPACLTGSLDEPRTAPVAAIGHFP